MKTKDTHCWKCGAVNKHKLIDRYTACCIICGADTIPRIKPVPEPTTKGDTTA